MDSNAQDSIDALQALLNFKRSAQVTRTQDVKQEVSTTHNIPSSVTEVKSVYRPQSQVRPNNPLAPSIKNNTLSVANLDKVKSGVNTSSDNSKRVIETLPFNSTVSTETGNQANIPTHTLRFNPYLFGQNSEKFQIYPLSLPLSAANPLHVETPNPLSARPQVPQIPHSFSIPATFISPKEDTRKPPAKTPTLFSKGPITATQSRILNTSTPNMNTETSEKSAKKQNYHEQSPVIRSEEVEAALRSKPQRGKKRNNLSVLERLELTRTRNREHAKCTRARKKMRMEQLESNEKKCFELTRLQDLASARRGCVQKFMALRNERLSHKIKVNTNPESAWQFSLDPVTNESETNAGQTSQRFQQGIPDIKAQSPPLNDTNEATNEFANDLFDGVVKHFDSFQFVFQHGNTFSSQGLRHFLFHEKKILDYMKRSHGNSENCSIVFEIVGGADDISLSANNSGFALVDLVLSVSDQQKYVYNGFIEFRFESDSHELLYFKHHEFLAKPLHESDSASSSPLSQQVTFPSVVSLDMHSQGHVLPRLDINPHDTGARPQILQDNRVQPSNGGSVQAGSLGRIEYQHVDTPGSVGMDI